MDQKAVQMFKGSVILGGVGDLFTKSNHGIYQVIMLWHNAENATMLGVCLEKITATVPSYPLQGVVEQDLIQAFKETKKRTSKQLPICRRRYRLYDWYKIFALLSRKDIQNTNRTYYL